MLQFQLPTRIKALATQGLEYELLAIMDMLIGSSNCKATHVQIQGMSLRKTMLACQTDSQGAL